MPSACAWRRTAESGSIDIMSAKAAIRMSKQSGKQSGKQLSIQSAARPHAVAVVVFDGVAPFELGVACDVFGDAHGGPQLYTLSVCAAVPLVTTDSGFSIQVPLGLDAMVTANTIVVPPTGLAD